MKDIAIKIITKAFAGKLDLAGKPYIEHLNRVQKYVSNMNVYETIKEDLEIVALLHDILEDCPEWNKESLSAFFPDRIVHSIDCLTKRPNQTYDQYISQVLTDRYATIVKKADLIDNMDIKRLNEITDKDFLRLKKYHKAYLQLI